MSDTDVRTNQCDGPTHAGIGIIQHDLFSGEQALCGGDVMPTDATNQHVGEEGRANRGMVFYRCHARVPGYYFQCQWSSGLASKGAASRSHVEGYLLDQIMS